MFMDIEGHVNRFLQMFGATVTLTDVEACAN